MLATQTPMPLLDASARLARLYQIEPHTQEAMEYLRTRLSEGTIALLDRSAAFFLFEPVNALGDRRAVFQLILSSDEPPNLAETLAIKEISQVLEDEFCVAIVRLYFLNEEVS